MDKSKWLYFHSTDNNINNRFILFAPSLNLEISRPASLCCLHVCASLHTPPPLKLVNDEKCALLGYYKA